MRSFWSKFFISKQIIFYIVLILFIAIVSFLFIYIVVTNKDSNGNDIEINFLIYVATVALAVIAYKELERSNKELERSNQLNNNELLIFISNRWNSKEIIKARQIIHEIFVYKYRYDKADKTGDPKKDFENAMKATSNDIYEMSKKVGGDGKKFVYLLNLLDHFENISYLSSSNQINLEEAYNIYGNNIIFYYQSLKEYIEKRQFYHPSDFENFTRLYKILDKEKIKREKMSGKVSN